MEQKAGKKPDTSSVPDTSFSHLFSLRASVSDWNGLWSKLEYLGIPFSPVGWYFDQFWPIPSCLQDQHLRSEGYLEGFHSIFVTPSILIKLNVLFFGCCRNSKVRHVTDSDKHGYYYDLNCLLLVHGYFVPEPWCVGLKHQWNKAGWWFESFFIFHNIWDNPSHWRTHILQDGYCTTSKSSPEHKTRNHSARLRAAGVTSKVDGSCRCQEAGIRYWRPRGYFQRQVSGAPFFQSVTRGSDPIISHDRSRWFSTVIPVIPIWFPCHPHGEASTVEGESPVEAGPSAAVCWRSRGSPSAGGVGAAEPWNVARLRLSDVETWRSGRRYQVRVEKYTYSYIHI